MAIPAATPTVRGGTPVLTALLFSGMGAGTFALIALGILATFIIEDLGITRAELGFVIGADTLIAAVLSPLIGRGVDRLGGKRALMVLFFAAATGWVLYGLAPVYGLLFAGALLTGIADGSCNPSTNRLIVETLPVGGRGFVTGIKQSGVQAGVFLGGVTLPSMAVAFGWRPTLFIVATLPIALVVAVSVLIDAPPPKHSAASHAERKGPLPASIRWLAGYGFLFGFAGAVALLVPLYVEEALGLDARIGGLVAAAIGLVAVGGRIWWARIAEKHDRFIEPLWAMTPLAVAAGGAFLLAESAAVWLVWVGAALTGLSTSSWNGVGMLATMNEAGAATTGKASGVVVSGFLLGLGLGPPVYGALVDATGSYIPMWTASIAAAAAAGVWVAAWRWSNRRPESAEESTNTPGS